MMEIFFKGLIFLLIFYIIDFKKNPTKINFIKFFCILVQKYLMVLILKKYFSLKLKLLRLL